MQRNIMSCCVFVSNNREREREIVDFNVIKYYCWDDEVFFPQGTRRETDIQSVCIENYKGKYDSFSFVSFWNVHTLAEEYKDEKKNGIFQLFSLIILKLLCQSNDFMFQSFSLSYFFSLHCIWHFNWLLILHSLIDLAYVNSIYTNVTCTLRS